LASASRRASVFVAHQDRDAMDALRRAQFRLATRRNRRGEMSAARNEACEILRLTDADHRSYAVRALIEGRIIVLAFNGIFVLVGDADNPTVPEKVAIAKGRPHAKGVALVCPPEFLSEHVSLDAPRFRSRYPFDKIQGLFQAVHAVGLILPSALPGAPPHLIQSGTILNVWTEQHPESPLRQLIHQFRECGHRALAGTSANLAGRPTITDPAEVQRTFAGRVPLMLLDSVDHVPVERRHSASIVDLTGPVPRLVREGSVTEAELRTQFQRLALEHRSCS
jgi:tRNA A37 threonylcarbamoyladenosine synthetase subunit TsaC/SUA5/YrdC